jgi:hypothetical protein
MKILTYKEFRKKNNDFLKDAYEHFSRQYTNNEIEIEFEIFCYVFWFNYKIAKPGGLIVYTNNLHFLNACIQNYIRLYSGKITEKDFNKLEYIKGLFHLQNYFPKTLYALCCAFLGLDMHYSNEIIEEIKISDFYKNLSEKNKKEFENFQKKNFPKIPKNRQNETLIKHFLETAIHYNDVPTDRQLESSIYSASSYNRKMNNINFLSELLGVIEKRLNNKRLSKTKKELFIKLKLYVNNKLSVNQKIETQKTGITKRHKPDFNDNIGDEVNKMFDELQL